MKILTSFLLLHYGGRGGLCVLGNLWQPTVSVPRRRGNCVVQNMHVKQQLYWRDDCPDFVAI